MSNSTEGPFDERVTATIQIGNSDDKLTQAEWSQFVASVDGHLCVNVTDTHFRGFAPGGWSRCANPSGTSPPCSGRTASP